MAVFFHNSIACGVNLPRLCDIYDIQDYPFYAFRRAVMGYNEFYEKYVTIILSLAEIVVIK